jgi:hypothetical protein
MTLRPLRAYRRISRDLTRLQAADIRAKEEARLELTRRATLFSRRSRRVVDDTMQLSAVLLRAGEVEEANKLLVEVDRHVEDERTALIETVNEVESEGESRRRRMTKLRLARMLVTAILGTGLMVSSAFGVALATYLVPDEPRQPRTLNIAGGFPTHDRGDLFDLRLHEIEVAPGIMVALTRSQLAVLQRLTSSGRESELEAFLRDLLPGRLANEVTALAEKLEDGIEGAREELAKLEKNANNAAKAPDSPEAEAESDKKKKSEGKNDGSGNDGGESDESCDDDDKSGDDESGIFGGDCIPLVNKESPL